MPRQGSPWPDLPPARAPIPCSARHRRLPLPRAARDVRAQACSPPFRTRSSFSIADPPRRGASGPCCGLPCLVTPGFVLVLFPGYHEARGQGRAQPSHVCFPPPRPSPLSGCRLEQFIHQILSSKGRCAACMLTYIG